MVTKIEGPWLWVTVPGKRLTDRTDLLAEASSGSVTEDRVAIFRGIKRDACRKQRMDSTQNPARRT